VAAGGKGGRGGKEKGDEACTAVLVFYGSLTLSRAAKKGRKKGGLAVSFQFPVTSWGGRREEGWERMRAGVLLFPSLDALQGGYGSRKKAYASATSPVRLISFAPPRASKG